MVQQREIILGGNQINASNPMSTSVVGITMPAAVVSGQKIGHHGWHRAWRLEQ